MYQPCLPKSPTLPGMQVRPAGWMKIHNFHLMAQFRNGSRERQALQCSAIIVAEVKGYDSDIHNCMESILGAGQLYAVVWHLRCR